MRRTKEYKLADKLHKQQAGYARLERTTNATKDLLPNLLVQFGANQAAHDLYTNSGAAARSTY